jgi:hypothetical protein
VPRIARASIRFNARGLGALIAGAAPFVAFLACGEVQSGDTATSDAASDSAGDTGRRRADAASDARGDDRADARPDAQRDATLDSPRVPLDATSDARLDALGETFAPDHFVSFDGGREAGWPPDGGFLGPPDALWLVDAPVDAASCESVAAALCARVAACPLRVGETQLCVSISPETLCLESYANCVALFAQCVPTSNPPPNLLTLLPNSAECAAALEADNCRQQGQDHEFEMPASCAVCPPPWNTLDLCMGNTGDK